MRIELKVPPMGESISQVTIGSILKPSGSEVKIDDELLEFETDKLAQPFYASGSGIFTLIVAQGDVVDVGQPIGFIDMKMVATQEVEKTAPIAPSPSPLPAISSQSETRKKLSPLRKTLSQKLVAAQKESATLTTFNEVDMTEVMKCREKYKEAFMTKYGVKLGLMSFFVKAAVSALQAFPQVNAYLDSDDIVYRNYFDISVAIATERGLIVPVIKNCDALSFADIEKAIADFSLRAKNGQLSVDELQGGGFTITNGGTFGSLLSTPILNFPQSAILGMHKITKRPCVVDDQIVIRSMMYLALSYDHRLIDGKEAVSFLMHIKNCIEEPLRLELEV